MQGLGLVLGLGEIGEGAVPKIRRVDVALGVIDSARDGVFNLGCIGQGPLEGFDLAIEAVEAVSQWDP